MTTLGCCSFPHQQKTILWKHFVSWVSHWRSIAKQMHHVAVCLHLMPEDLEWLLASGAWTTVGLSHRTFPLTFWAHSHIFLLEFMLVWYAIKILNTDVNISELLLSSDTEIMWLRSKLVNYNVTWAKSFISSSLQRLIWLWQKYWLII